MTLQAFVLIRTSIFVIVNELARPPIRTLVLLILVQLRFPPEILPIVRINANVSLVFGFIVWTPNAFEMEHIEIYIFGELVN